MNKQKLKRDAIRLLEGLISIPSFSRHEDKAAILMSDYLHKKHIQVKRNLNNVWAYNKHYDPKRTTILLNSHLDTVQPASGWSLDPFKPTVRQGKLYGLGSNDAGGSLVSLMACFLYFHDKTDLPFNLIMSATAEEEISGENGISAIMNEMDKIDLAIVGEPTDMDMAIAEKGLMVLDCYTEGKSTHAAHASGENAITTAVRDMNWFQNFRFPNESQLLGPVKMNVTMIEAGIQHNIIPACCKFTVDIRTTDSYSNHDVLSIIKKNVSSRIVPRSVNLNPSIISRDHLIVQAATKTGLKLIGSPTTSDQALLACKSVKIGPGDSVRSHTADEYIRISEIENGIEVYIQLLDRYGELIKTRV